MILINYNNIHFRMGYYNISSILDLNFNIHANNNNEVKILEEEEIVDKTYFTNTNDLFDLKELFNQLKKLNR